MNTLVEVETPALVIGAVVDIKVIATKIDTAYFNDLLDSAFTGFSVSLDSIASNAPNSALNSLIGGLVSA